MFDPKEAGRLLREDWKNPADLAKELYSMLRGREPRSVPAPERPRESPTAQALRLSRGPVVSRPETAALAFAKQQSVPAPGPIAKFSTGPDPEFRSAPQARFEPQGVARPPGPSRESAFTAGVTIEVDTLGVRARATPDQAATRPANISGNLVTQVQSGPSGGVFPGLSREPSTSDGPFAASRQPVDEPAAPAYQDPPPAAPLQRPPFSYAEGDQDYADFQFRPDLTLAPTSLPRQDFFWGLVVSGSGRTYSVSLYEDPESDVIDTVPVTVWKMSDAATLPPGSPLFPIHRADSGKYFAQPPVWLGGS